MNAVVKELPDMVDGLYMGKYNIHHPDTVKFVERTPFIQSICGHIDASDKLEDLVYRLDPFGGTLVSAELRGYADMYIRLRNKGARLPKFSRWITGMWSSNKEYADYLASEGQKAAARKIIMSCDLLDVLRCADTPHFASCFQKSSKAYAASGYDRIPVQIAEECPGIGIVYVDDENGKMMGRQWMHHAKLVSTGEDICVLANTTYGCLQGRNVARLMAERGIKVATAERQYSGQEDMTPIEYQGCFKSEVHHDLMTWDPKPRATIIKI